MFSLAGVEKMRKTVELLRKEIGDRPATPSKDRICGALATLRSQGAVALDGAQFYFACWGLTESCGNLPPLMEDRRHFLAMMAEVQKRLPRSLLWRGLLDAYFRYAPQAGSEGEQHWRVLRNWLAKDLQALRNRIPSALRELPWLAVLQTNYVLLEDNPCWSYAASALQGDRTQIAKIEAALGIPEVSWFWRELVYSQIKTATGWRDDASFKQVLDTLLAQLAVHPVIRDKGLAKLLTRYERCANKSVHQGLKRFSVEAWGNPDNDSWGLVASDVRRMVQEWISLEDLCDFFRLLRQSGHDIDKKRLEFWIRYVGKMTRTHILLGTHAWSSFASLRANKPGRISRLKGTGVSNNAFIMEFDGFVFVEFSHTGNAAFGYPSKHFETLYVHNAIDKSYLSDRGQTLFYEWHTPDNWDKYKFPQALSRLGIEPDRESKQRQS
jgi:hypothetical protein